MGRTSSPTIRALQARLADRVHRLPVPRVQNVLMATTDRNLALALLGCENDLEHVVFARIATGKADRVRSELAIMEHRRVAAEYVRGALVALLAALESSEKADGRTGYWRPRRGGDPP